MKLELSLSNLVTKAARVVTRDYQREVAHLGISPSQAGVVYIVGRVGPLSQVEIARLLHLDKTNVNAMVRKLERAGFLAFGSDPEDARKCIVALTASGKDLVVELNEIDRRVGLAYLELARDPAEAAAVRRYLEKIVFG
jgi:DNA-binding MarR family transcriptional regulator